MSDLQDQIEISEPTELSRAFASCFAGPSGELVLAHLRRSFLDRRLPPTARDAELWYLEGQRAVSAYILRMSSRR
jgi:hypothetical protein